MNPSRWRIVFDCNVLVQAAASPGGAAATALRLLDQNRIEVCVSRAVLRELRNVLNYPTIRRKLVTLTDRRVEEFLRALAYRAILVSNVSHRFNYPRARQDEPYLDLAVAARAHYLLSRDKDLLSLQSEHSQFAKRLRQLCPAIQIVKPEEFLSGLALPSVGTEPRLSPP